MKNAKLKKSLKIVGDVLFGILLVFILFIAVTNMRAKGKNGSGIPNLFGHGYMTVESDSMNGDKKDSFTSKDLIFVKFVNEKEAKNLKVNDIITYHDLVNGEVRLVTHRIIEVKEGSPMFLMTQGDNKVLQEQSLNGGIASIRPDEVIAVYEGKWVGAADVFRFFSSGPGFFIIVVVPCILFLIFEIINFVRVYMEYRQEKNKVALAGGPDSIENKIRMRKEAFDDLVNEGTLSREQADAALQEYINGLVKTSATVDATVENVVSSEDVIDNVEVETPKKTRKTTKKNDVE